MKTSTRTLLLLVLLAASLPLRADEPAPAVTIQCTAIALPKAQALRFIDEHRLDTNAAAGMKDLMMMVGERRAESVANPAVTTKSGQKATSEGETTTLEVEPVIGPDGNLIDLNLQFNYLEKKISTSVTARRGEVKFLGAFDSAETPKNVTYFVFVRVRLSG